MWLNGRRNLCIYKSRYVNIVTCNTRDRLEDLEEMQETKCALSHQDCEEFLIENARDIETLKLQGDVKDVQLNMRYLELHVDHFVNLKKLIFHEMVVTDESLQVIGENCRQLNSLQLIKCFCEHFWYIMPGVNLNIYNICNIKCLQELEIQPPTGSVQKFKLEYVHQLVKSLIDLQHLNLNHFTIDCEDDEKNNISYQPVNEWPLKVLNIGLITSDFWCTFTGILKCCPHLRQLTISASEEENIVVNIKIIDILFKYCKHLTGLDLENCEIDVEDFRPLQELEQLTLKSCRGVTFNNLQQIFGGLKLKTFKLLNTCIFDIENHIYTTSTLESITIDTIQSMEISEIFKKCLNDFSGLRSLHWLNADISHSWIVEKCPQLQQLYISNHIHLSRIVMQMKSLRELTLSADTGLSWSLLKMMIFSLSLKRLNIYTTIAIMDEHGSSQNFAEMLTSLEFVTIPYQIFLMKLKYWLELLNLNEHFRLMIYGRAEDILNVRLLCLLLTADCVQRRCKYIKICGFHLGNVVQAKYFTG